MFKNCQAARDVLAGIVEEDDIDTLIRPTHNSGMAISSMCAYNDVRQSIKQGTDITDGKDFFSWIVNTYRSRDDNSHQWMHNWKVAEKEGPDRVFYSCKAFDEQFGACQGCPWRGEIRSPKQFIFGKTISRSLTRRMELKTPEKIRSTTFPTFKKEIDNALRYREKKNLLLASPQGSGKSYSLSGWASELANRNYKVLIAVPTAELALEHLERIKDSGGDAFVLMSHKNIFANKEKLGFDFECPSYSEIQELMLLGVSSYEYKSEHCKGCPLLNKCYYPNQYTEVLDPKHKIVIIQHAHFSCQEVIYDLMKKEFDVLFVDETFINNTYVSIKVQDYEWRMLEKFKFKWLDRFISWLRGVSPPGSNLFVKEEDLRKIKKEFTRLGVDYRIPDLIRLYNQKRNVNKFTGIEVVYELPNTPVKVFTDATPPLGLLQEIIGGEIEVFGADEIIDIKSIHPDNEIIQVLDTSASRTFLEKDDNLENILSKIGELVENHYLENPEAQYLITVSSYYMKDKVEQFFLDNLEVYPSTSESLTVSILSKGTNKYKDFDMQFLIAGRYSLGKEFVENTYKFKTVSNYSLSKQNKEQYSNIYPYAVTTSTSVPIYKDSVRRIEYIDSKSCGEYQYSDFNIYPPKGDTPDGYWYRLLYEYNVAETQQAIRIRFSKDKPKKVYIFSNYNLPGIVVSKSIMFKDFINLTFL